MITIFEKTLKNQYDFQLEQDDFFRRFLPGNGGLFLMLT